METHDSYSSVLIWDGVRFIDKSSDVVNCCYFSVSFVCFSYYYYTIHSVRILVFSQISFKKLVYCGN